MIKLRGPPTDRRDLDKTKLAPAITEASFKKWCARLSSEKIYRTNHFDRLYS
jgi:hypothetical protein